MSTRTVTRPEDLDAVTALWRGLESQAHLPTQSLSWARAGAETLHAECGLHVLATGAGPDAADGTGAAGGAVAPLALEQGRLHLLGVSLLSEPADFLATSEEALELVTRKAVGTRPLLLHRLPADSPTLGALERVARGRAGVRCRPHDASPRIVLDDAWHEPESKLSSKRRSDLRRAGRRAEQLGPMDLHVHEPSAEDLDPLLDEAWGAEARSWRAKRQGALAQDPVRGPFFRRYAHLAAEEGSLRLALLRVDGRAIAMQLAVVYAGAFWLLKVGFDEEHGRLSPGMLLTAATIRYAAEAGLHAYEFLGVVEPWTQIWTEQVREYVNVRTYPYGPRGACAFWADGVGALRVRLARKDA